MILSVHLPYPLQGNPRTDMRLCAFGLPSGATCSLGSKLAHWPAEQAALEDYRVFGLLNLDARAQEAMQAGLRPEPFEGGQWCFLGECGRTECEAAPAPISGRLTDF